MSATTIAKARLTSPPCGKCGSTGGWARSHRSAPKRVSGERFGVAGGICHTCFTRLSRQAHRGSPGVTIRVPPCDLCGEAGGESVRPGCAPTRYDARPFNLEGRLCGGCRRELIEEKRDAAGISIRPLVLGPAYRPFHPDTVSGPARGPIGLEVLDGGFTRDELTPRAACAILRRTAKRMNQGKPMLPIDRLAMFHL